MPCTHIIERTLEIEINRVRGAHEALSLSGASEFDGGPSENLSVNIGNPETMKIHGAAYEKYGLDIRINTCMCQLQVVLLLTVILNQRAHWVIENPLSSLVPC